MNLIGLGLFDFESIIHLAQNKKLDKTCGVKLRFQLKSNWIFSKLLLLIYIYRERERDTSNIHFTNKLIRIDM